MATLVSLATQGIKLVWLIGLMGLLASAGWIEPVNGSVTGLAQTNPTTAVDTTQTARLKPITDWAEKNPKVTVGIASVAGLGLIYLVILGLKPRWLLLIPEKLTIPGTKVDVPLALLRWLKYRPTVLDAWVAGYLSQVEEQFLEKPTVSQRDIHISILINWGSQSIDLSPQQLRPIFSRSPATLVIWGEGGVGKTSLACQIGRWAMGLGSEPGTRLPRDTMMAPHRMLPVLIEHELEKSTLLTAIRDQLPRNRDGDFVSDQLLEALLKRQRVLVILDHVSEMKDDTYQQMQEMLSKTPINALIITTRLSYKYLGRPHPTLLEPKKIEGALDLLNFIQPYLERKGKKNLFEDDQPEFLSICLRLSRMLAATLETATAMLVRMYVDLVIEEGDLKTAQLPDSIPNLMLEYLDWLNRRDAVAKEVRREDDEIQRDAKVVAWKCLEETYRPSSADYSHVMQALEAVNPDAARLRLIYLIDRLRLLKVEGDRVRIMLDPVAEYLAAFHVVEHNQREDAAKRWQYFFDRLDADPDNLPTIRGFLLAIRNCAQREEKRLPAGVLDGLNQRADLKPEELEQAARRQRINRQIDNLYDRSSKIVSQSIRNLQEQGHHAARAIPDLLKMTRSHSTETALRVEALDALMHIHMDRAALDQLCQDLLSDRSDEPEIRVEAIAQLMQGGLQPEQLAALLNHYFEDQSEAGVVRVRAGEGLRQLGRLNQQLLVVELDAVANPTIHLLEPPQTQTVPLAEGVELILVRIPPGQFEMGAPEGEGYTDEQPHHLVTVSEFWLGQVPVTQVQYEAVLGQNPAYFSEDGTNCPVEYVSWYDAKAFCQRLSEQTGKEFRLPTEAEWEYACRAGTTTPFHLGATITTDLANYRGTDWVRSGQIYPGHYGDGPKGTFREQTTPVGSFPPNAFGLYDMHGNVWEWCLDHWHDSYEGAPTDGSAWLSDNENSYRLLRGGSWNYNPRFCRSACRNWLTPDDQDDNIGFRVVCASAWTS